MWDALTGIANTIKTKRPRVHPPVQFAVCHHSALMPLTAFKCYNLLASLISILVAKDDFSRRAL